MTARPPRASTRGDGRRARPRGATHSERSERPDKQRALSVVQTDRFERIGDDAVVEVTELPELPQLRVLVLESAANLAAAQGAIAAAGHVVVRTATGREGIDKLRPAVGDVDAMLVALPGGEPLIDAALARGAGRPVVIAAASASAVRAVERALAAGADLATVRPHDVERLAPILLAAARLVEQRRQVAARAPVAPGSAETAALSDMLDELADAEPGGLLAMLDFQRAAQRELERAERYAYPLAVAMFSMEFAKPPPGLRGILRARAGNALVHALRDIDLATEVDPERFLVVMPYTDRVAGAEVARRIITAVSAGDPVVAAGRAFPAKVTGAVAGAVPGAALEVLVRDVTQLLEQAYVTGASLAVES